MPTSLHIVKSAEPECTGMVRIITGLAQHAASCDYRVSVLFLGEGPLQAYLEAKNIPSAVVRWNGSRGDLGGALRAWRWLSTHPSEVVHVHNGGHGLRMLCRWAGARAIVQHVHGEVLEPDLSSVSKLRFRGADAVIACSRSVADHLSGCNPEVIYAGVETGDSAPAGPPQTGPIRLGVLSRLVPLKRIEAVVEVTARLAAMGIDVQAEICGKGPSEPGLRSLTEKLGMTERVRFLGWREDVGDLLASWHLVVLPSMTEGLGLAVLEAMAAGRTAVASRVGGLRELVVDGITGKLVPPGDTGALVECIAELARDRERLELMGAAAWERAHTHFSNDLMVQKTTGLYEHLLSRKG